MPETVYSSNFGAVSDLRQEVVPYQSLYMPGPDPVEESGSFTHHFWIVRKQWWKIALFVAICVISVYVVSKRMSPWFEATATIDIDPQIPQNAVGRDSNAVNNIDADQFLATQIDLIQSDTVLRPVAEKYNLLQEEKQITERSTPQDISRIRQAPTVLKKLKVDRPPNTYLLHIAYRSHDPQLAAAVANATARNYIQTTYNIRYRSSADLSAFMEKQLDELKAKMERSSAALAKFEQELNVINPEQKTNIVSARLLQLITEYTNAQGDRVRKEAAYNSMKNGSLEAAQVSTQGDSLKTLTDKLDEAQQRFADVKGRFGVNHPEYKKAQAATAELKTQIDQARQNIGQRVTVEYHQAVDRQAMLDAAIRQTKAEADQLNSRSVEYDTLKNEADADKKFYDELIGRIKEATINSGFQSSAIRLANLARPPAASILPNITLNVALVLLFSALLGIGAAVLGDLWDDTLRDPQQVIRKLHTEVVGILPFDRSAKALQSSLTGRARKEAALLRSGEEVKPDILVGVYGDAIRTLRNSVLLSNAGHPLSSILITSASPSEGKTTTAVHLAMAHAEQGRRTLLIDCDLRRPSVHKHFSLPNERGMSDVSTGTLSWQQVVLEVPDHPNLDVLLAGPGSRRAANLTVGNALIQVLEESTRHYDLVIVDGPPVIGFPEPLQIATAVDGVVVMALAGKTEHRIVRSVLITLKRLHSNVLGIVLNKMNRDLSNSYYYYGAYSKYGKHYYSDDPQEL
jgi:succinoglycan biosynthesis transport protein ExoP